MYLTLFYYGNTYVQKSLYLVERGEEGVVMALRQRGNFLRNMRGKKIGGARAVAILFVVACALFGTLSFAAETAKYQVVPGSDDKAYLVNTTTGAVWVLTYRSLPTGREPIAIPYKFIKISPRDRQQFLIEDVPGVTTLLPGDKP